MENRPKEIKLKCHSHPSSLYDHSSAYLALKSSIELQFCSRKFEVAKSYTRSGKFYQQSLIYNTVHLQLRRENLETLIGASNQSLTRDL